MDEKPERSREAAIRKSGQRNRRRRRAIKIRISLILFIILLGTGIALSFTVLFPVKSVSVSGKTIYTEQQIIDASHIKINENLLALKTVDISKEVAKKLPYIGSAKVKRILPDKVKLIVEPTTPVASYFYNENYYITDKHSKLLEKSAAPVDGSMKILGAKIKNESVGDTLVFEENTTKQIIERLYDSMKSQKIVVTSIDVSDDLSIIVVIENRIKIEFGSYSDLEYKIAHLKGMLGQIDENIPGTINLKMWSKSDPQGYFKKDTTSSS